ncbi:MAG: methyltransferase domain-containing protein [Acidobacteriota bacterium]|nr:methyltransferase domain-containing protein [Acidobacteriota bacterium]
MNADVLSRLRCPACHSPRLDSIEFLREDDELIEGVVWCLECRTWYPLEDGFLDFLTGPLAYPYEKKRFWKKWESELSALSLAAPDLNPATADSTGGKAESQAQALQQREHFDWYASNEEQRYSEYEVTPFWRAADRIAFDPWKAELQANEREDRWLLDVGCAQGRSSFHFMDQNLNLVGIDVSRKCIQEAARRYREGNFRAKASFVVADGSALPFRESTVDYVLIYGVLHHLADPAETCREVARVMKPKGVYFGQENNATFFRAVFDLVQKTWPIWHEEAGPEAIISARRLGQWLKPGGFRLSTRTSVFVLPHVINLTSEKAGYVILKFLDRAMGMVPWISRNGGLIIFEARRP